MKKRDNIVQKQFDRQDVRLAHHRKYLGNHQEDIKQIVKDQVCMVNRMTGYEEKACRCGEDSKRLSHLSYGEPPVASLSGPSFPSEGSPQPIPVLPPTTIVADPEFPVSPSSPGDSDKENSNKGSFESTQQVVTKLVEIQEEEVLDEDAQALSDAMDEEVRSQLFQHCRSKNHPECFAPYPKGWQNGLRPCERRRTFRPRLEIDREIFVRTRNLREGLLGNVDVESDHSGDVPSVLERLTSFPTALPVSLQLSLLRDAFAMPSRSSPLKFFVPRASLLSLELPRLPRSFAVFCGVPQSSPELLLVHRSSSLSAGVAATSSEPLSLGVLRRFFAKLPLSLESFPVVSYDAAIAS